MSCVSPRLLRVIGLTVMAAGLLVAVAPAASATQCLPDDKDCLDRQLKVGRDGLAGTAVLTSNGRGGVRVLAGGTDCVNCFWKLERCDATPSNGPGGDPRLCSDGRSPACTVAQTGERGLWYRSLFSAVGPDGPWEDRGFVCVGEGETPFSIDTLFAQVRSYVDQLVPAAPRVSMQPAGVTIVRLPTLFQAGQPGDPANRPTSKVFFASAGGRIAINVTVTPQEWTWRVDGGQTATVSSGYCCRYYDPAHSPRKDPDYYASHTFDATGSHTATVSVTWSATMTISGLGTVPVDGTFTRDSPAYPFQVKQARSQLEDGG